tara:strand:- start:1326 stop:1562 length:237 start_codon:yes stop_codon:yes gene_type:complete
MTTMTTDTETKTTDAIPRDLTFSLSIPLGDKGVVSINSSGSKTAELIDFEATIKVKTQVDDLESVVKLIEGLVKSAKG